jgi:hypothetical protein
LDIYIADATERERELNKTGENTIKRFLKHEHTDIMIAAIIKLRKTATGEAYVQNTRKPASMHNLKNAQVTIADLVTQIAINRSPTSKGCVTNGRTSDNVSEEQRQMHGDSCEEPVECHNMHFEEFRLFRRVCV